MAKMMFYERPVALNRERHQHLKLAVAADHFRFAAKTNAMPVMSTEFAEAARDYPIVFVGEEAGPLNLAVLVGLRDGENLMVDKAGQWAPGTYVPAFARRYPFVLAKSDTGDRLAVCIDEVYPGLAREDGEALFDGGGKETPYLERMLGFLRAFHAEAQRTTDFAARLKELGLLVPKIINVERQGRALKSLRGIWVVDPVKLRGIDDQRAIEFFRNGYMGWIEAHLISLGSLPRLLTRLGEDPPNADASSLPMAAGTPAPADA